MGKMVWCGDEEALGGWSGGRTGRGLAEGRSEGVERGKSAGDSSQLGDQHFED
jgi:hypothetical protein